MGRGNGQVIRRFEQSVLLVTEPRKESPVPHLYDFADADGSNRDLLGGKGAGLAEMTGLGLPVPPGFILTTEVCRRTMETGSVRDAPTAVGRSRSCYPCAREPSSPCQG